MIPRFELRSAIIAFIRSRFPVRPRLLCVFAVPRFAFVRPVPFPRRRIALLMRLSRICSLRSSVSNDP
jgi:hypothetical protein